MTSKSSKEKGNLLEKILGQLCAGIRDAKVENNVRTKGASGVVRQIDTLITGKVGSFEVKIIVDAKNYTKPVDIKDVESISGMAKDVNANLGVIVCPAGFTNGAKQRADTAGIQLYEIYNEALGNTNLFIPLRYVTARINKYQFTVHSSSPGPLSFPSDMSSWRLEINGQEMTARDVPMYIWNNRLVPQRKGDYSVKLGAIKIGDQQEKVMYYCDLDVGMDIIEDYYLKLFPASFLKKADDSGKTHFDLRIDAYSKHEDMLKNGWHYFKTMEEMNKEADIENQPTGIRELIMYEEYSFGDTTPRNKDVVS